MYSHRDYDHMVTHLEVIFGRFSNRNIETILDAGCGTGEFAKRFVERGYQLVGFDLQSSMVQLAMKKVRDADFLLADMSRFVINQRFDAILCLSTTFNYCEGYLSAARTLKRFYDHLSEGGLVIMDICPSTWPYLRETSVGVYPNKQLKVFSGRDTLVFIQKYSFLPDFHREKAYAASEFTILEHGKLIGIMEDRHILSLFSPYVLEDLMRKIGFRKIKLFRGYTFKRFPNRVLARIMGMWKRLPKSKMEETLQIAMVVGIK